MSVTPYSAEKDEKEKNQDNFYGNKLKILL